MLLPINASVCMLQLKPWEVVGFQSLTQNTFQRGKKERGKKEAALSVTPAWQQPQRLDFLSRDRGMHAGARILRLRTPPADGQTEAPLMLDAKINSANP